MMIRVMEVSNAAIPDTRSTKGNGDQKLGDRDGHLFYRQLLLLVLVVTVFTNAGLLVISPFK
jgi:hypothetical protein